MNIVVDSCVWISLLDTTDSNHERAVADLEDLDQSDNEIWVTEHIIDEVSTILQKRSQRKQLDAWMQKMFTKRISVFSPKNQWQAFKLIRSTHDLLMKQGKTKASFTDLYTKVVVEESYLYDSSVLSYDKHMQ